MLIEVHCRNYPQPKLAQLTVQLTRQ